MKTEPQHLHIEGGEYVLLPRAEYLRMVRENITSREGLRVPEAKAAMLREMGRRVRLAREHAALTQAALAAKLGVTQAMVSRAESGTVSVSSKFLGRVHKACKLPEEWIPDPEAK